MNCTQAIEYIHSLERFGIKPGLERIEELCRILGNPQKNLKFVHVAGTNGKGSTSTMISEILIKAGYNTGLFTSPYVVDFRERIKFNGSMIEPEELASCVEQVKAAVDILNKNDMQPTEFEVITAAAFVYFKKKNCDIVVLEVGLGGRLDSTNVIDCPEVNVLTSISKDHTAVLGDTLTLIAGEKCGTLKPGGTCVCYPEQSDEAKAVIESTCEKLENRLVVPDLTKLSIISSNAAFSVFDYKGLNITLPLPGVHMIKNAVTAVETIGVLREKCYVISDDNIISGMAECTMPARLETVRENPLVIIDGGHNEGCALALAKYVRENLGGRKITAVMSMMADKDYGTYLSITAPLFGRIIASHTAVARSLSADDLRFAASQYCNNCVSVADSFEAVKLALESAGKDGVIIICGSFYFAGEVRPYLTDGEKTE